GQRRIGAPVAQPINDGDRHWDEQRRQHQSKAGQAREISRHGSLAFHYRVEGVLLGLNHGQTVGKLGALSAAANSLTARSAAVDASRRSMSDSSSRAGIAQVNSSSGKFVRVRLTAQPGLTATSPPWA